MNYPSEHSVELANNVELRRWHRFLPSPRTQHQLSVMNLIHDRVSAFEPSEAVLTSKVVGWDA